MDAKQGLDRIVREQAFTVLNRLAALRMAEARGLLTESVGSGFQAKGFQLYARLAGMGLGETGDTLEDLKRSIQRQGQERLRQRMEEERAKTDPKGPAKLSRSIAVPARMTSVADIDQLIKALQEAKMALALYSEIDSQIDIRIVVGNDTP